MKEFDEMDRHPGMPYKKALLAYGRSKDIFAGNSFEIRRFTLSFETGEMMSKLGIEQRHLFRSLDGHLVRYLHNFLASVQTLVEHTRVLMRSDIIRASHRLRYEEKVAETFNSAEVAQFIQGFRNYCVHYGTPMTVHTIELLPKEQWQVLLDTKHLLEWQNWGAKARAYLVAHQPTMRLLALIEEYEKLVISFNTWFVTDYAAEYAELFASLDTLHARLKAEFDSRQSNQKPPGKESSVAS